MAKRKPKDDESCGTCRYWYDNPDETDKRGQCRRFPEELTTNRTYWCGEWEAK